MDIALLIHGGPLPEQLDVPPHLHRQFDRLWRRSVASQTEWGLTLTVDRAGRVRGRHLGCGTDEGFVPDLTMPRRERLLGTFHTHVYTTGDTGMAFSDNDFVWFLTHPEVTLSLLQSGDVLFAMVRTPGTVEAVTHDFLGGNGQFYGQLADTYAVIDSYQDALVQTNVFFCERFGLAFYQGTGGQPLKGVWRP